MIVARSAPLLSGSSLAASLALHAVVVGGLLALGAGSTPPETARGGGASRLVWVSLPADPGAASTEAELPQAADVSALARVPSKPRPVRAGKPSRSREPERKAPPPAVTSAPAALARLRAEPALVPRSPAPRVVESAPGAQVVAAVAAPAVATSAGAASAASGHASPRADAGSEGLRDWPGPGDVDEAAHPRWPIRPDYPAQARQRGAEAMVVVEAWVDEGGEVALASVVRSGGAAFDESAQRAVKRAAFRPARRDGREVASRVALRIHFDLYD